MRETVKMTKLKSNNGITLIALVITIIVLLILAGVAISMLSGENGILNQAAKAKTSTDNASEKEQVELAALAALTAGHGEVNDDRYYTVLNSELDKIKGYEGEIKKGDLPKTITIGNNSYTIEEDGTVSIPKTPVKVTVGSLIESGEPVDANTPVEDDYGNKIIVPAGFKITDDADTVPEGIVIEDVGAGNVKDATTGEITNPTQGSQFVWIPVGNVYTTIEEERTSENTKEVILGRYEFNSSTGEAKEVQTVTNEDEVISAVDKTKAISANSNYYEVTPDHETYGTAAGYTNAKAKSLEGFLKSAVINGGYYIARYEAGDATATKNGKARTSETEGTLVCKANQQVYNYIKQTDASTLSKAMYINESFESDLINSYAWDTAIVFIQKMSGKNDYANQSSLNSGSPTTTGTSGDVQYNIYDMAGNVSEWSTETSGSADLPCVDRGGYYNGSLLYTRTRGSYSDLARKYFGFRPLLYVGLDSNS